VFTTPYFEEYNGGLNLLIQNKKKVENMSAQQQPSQQQTSPATRLLKIAKSTGATDGCPIFTAFAHQLFAHTPETELEARSDQELLDLCEEVFGVLETPLKDGDIKLEMLNPSYTHHSVAVINMYDQPFLVDSLWLELNRRGIEIHHTYHPIFNVKRDGKNKLAKITEEPTPETHRESFIVLEFDRQDAEDLKDIEGSLNHTLKMAQQVVEDFTPLTGKMHEVIDMLEHAKPHAPNEDMLENVTFLKWLLDDHFVFLGYRKYDLTHSGDTTKIKTDNGSGLGILRDDSESSLVEAKDLKKISKNLQRYMSSPEALTLTKAITKSTIHRHADMDYIGVKEFDEKGRVAAEHRFLGLFTSRAYTGTVRDIPLVRKKIENILNTEAERGSTGHNYRALTNILETYPRDELFQISIDDLHRITNGILHLKDRQHTRLFLRRSKDDRLISAMVFIPRDKLTRINRNKIANILSNAYNAEDITYGIHVSDQTLARLFYMIRTEEDAKQTMTDHEVEESIISITRSWEDGLRRSLCEAYGEHEGLKLFKTYGPAFFIGYQEHTSAEIALDDIRKIEGLRSGEISEDIAVSMHALEDGERASLRIFHRDTSLYLSEIMPILEKLGLHVREERPSQVMLDNKKFWIHDFVVEAPEEARREIVSEKVVERIRQNIRLAWRKEISNDRLNGLITCGNLGPEAIIVLRAYVAYLQQAGAKFSGDYVRKTLVRHSQVSGRLWKLFDARFNPEYSTKEAEKLEKEAIEGIKSALNDVTNLDEDIILNRFMAMIKATKRTNAFARNCITDPLAFKIASSEVPDLPKPLPLFEIFVYHVATEGVHLRGGYVARGGLRWSDRLSDYRTEVLGLMKTQMTKNAVIVPVGSKGGFVLKKAPCDLRDLAHCDRDALKQAVQDAYKIFIRSLLSVTDNIVNDKVVGPKNVRRHDGDDPYFVVAADKGTATFSDIANELSLERDFWLGDAFASGGSNGYDHKKMGITAKGAWESVKRHFRELGKDTQTEEFTVFGIGDMGGDVFGNGMLLSEKIQLVAAFNHLHIFIDPTPDAASSFKERKRLFENLGGWDQYNTDLISKGGGIFSRSDKEIKLTPEIQKLLGVRKDVMSPNELMTAILTMKAELFWNGGIGTFIKSTSETHADASDRANDSIRINAPQLNVKVIGEGGNLGMTQKARIEAARHGVHLNTDAIDNSAGVDCSDHEVNIKILIDKAVSDGNLKEADRNRLLANMTNEVSDLVLRDNYLQTQLLSYETVMRAVPSADAHWRMMKNFEKQGMLDRAVEFLPDDDEMAGRIKNNKGLTRPELSVLMAYTKMDLYNNLIKSDLPDDKSLEDYLYDYFPAVLQQKFEKQIKNHRLRREIIATCVANELINRMGLSFIYRLRDETGYQDDVIARAFILAKRLYGFDEEWAKIEALDGKVPAVAQLRMFDTIRRLCEHVCLWFLRHGKAPLNIEKETANYQELIQSMISELPKHFSKAMETRHKRHKKAWLKDGLDDKTADHMALAPSLYALQDIANAVVKTKQSPDLVMKAHYMMGEKLGMEQLHNKSRVMPNANYWQRVASQTIIDSLYSFQAQATLQAMDKAKGADKKPEAADLIKEWCNDKGPAMLIYRNMVSELESQQEVDHAMLNVALGHLKSITG
tara:strand:- start:422428 stop:427353 length:4926 start_codon:yes stop_codon:yes gene_type:complete